MSDPKELDALFPHLYPKELSPARLPRNGIRLFGSNWAFGIIGTLEPIAANGQSRLAATHFYGRDPGLYHDDEKYLHQNVFPLNIYGAADYDAKYPVLHEKPVGASTDLLVQNIAHPQDNKVLFQLLQGRVELPNRDSVAGRRKMLAKIRENLGLTRPAGAEQLSIYLYPDGVCVHGALSLPWGDSATDGWFKLTTRGASVAGAPTDDAEGGLVLCLDPALPGNDTMLAPWKAAAEELHDFLQVPSSGGARWLTLSRTASISPQDFFWPGNYQSGSRPYFTRASSEPIQLESRFLRVRVTPGRSTAQVISGMDIGSERLRIDRREHGRLRVGAAGAAPVSMLRYQYRVAPAGPETKKLEVLSLGSAAEAGSELRLAVPLIDTAAALRADSAMPARETVIKDDPVGPLWTFTPIENGVLHWPFPDATLEGLETLLEEERVKDQAAPSAEARGNPVAGAMLLGNEPALPGFDSEDRRWELSVTDGDEGWFELAFERMPGSTAGWTLASADVAVARCAIALEGAIPVIPFRQTEERLLPDHDERALRTRSLRAVSPSLLRGLEATMWRWAEKQGKTSKKRRVQAILVIRDFRLVAPDSDEPVRLEGRARLECTIHSRKPGDQPDPALKPWLWTRFGSLPAVQTLPLAVSGDAAFRPSGTRELHPLIRTEAAARLVYSFENALDMTRPAPRLVTSGKLEGQWRYGSAVYAQPWMSEIGMAVLTLPSVTIFPDARETADPARLPPPDDSAGWLWPVGNGASEADKRHGFTPFRMELRHDLAWCDERYAIAAAGSPEFEEDRGRGSFDPQPGNGPQHSDGKTSFAAAWERADRIAALAASDGRELVAWKKGRDRNDYFLQGFVGDTQHKISSLKFSRDLSIDANWERLRQAGSVEISLSTSSHPSGNHPPGDKMVLEGLPTSGDLSGYSGGLGGHLFDFGTLATGRAEAEPFADQRGLRSGDFSTSEGLRWRTVAGVNLYSLAAPQAAKLSGRAISFWFVDVPADRELANTSSQDWADYSNNHLEGLRWAVAEDGGKLDGYIHWRNGIYFEPTRLAKFSAGTGLTIRGRLGVIFKGEFVPQILGGDEELATLTIADKEGSGWICELAAAPTTRLQLEDSGQDAGPPALLALSGDLKKAVLHFDLFGHPAQAELAPDPSSPPGGLRFKLKKTGQADIRLSRALVDLTEQGPVLELDWTFRFASKERPNLQLAVEGVLHHPRYRGPEAGMPTAVINLIGKEAVTSWTVTSRDVHFDGSVLALSWADLFRKHESRAADKCWISFFPERGYAGALLALIQPSGGTTDFTCHDFRVEWEAGLARSLRLRVEARRSALATAALHGSMDVENADAGEELDHTATLRFDGSAVADVGARARVGAHALHKLTQTKPGGERRELEFPTVQWVTFEWLAENQGRIDFAAALVFEGARQRDTLLVLLPAHQPLGASPLSGGGDTELPPEPQVSPSCHDLPPLSPAAREAARLSLAEAVGAGAETFDNWAGRLLEGRNAGELRLSGAGPDAGLSKLFDQAAETATPLVYSLALPSRWRVPTSKRSYEEYLKLLAGQLARIILAVPPRFLADRNRRGYVLHSPDFHAERVIRAAREASVPVEAAGCASPALERWAKRLLASSAPWASCGLLTTYVTMKMETPGEGENRMDEEEIRATHFRLFQRTLVSEEKVRPAGPPWQPEISATFDPRRMAVPDTGGELSVSYVPAAVRAVDLSYHSAEDGEEEVGEAALAAHALQRMWQLSGLAAGKAPHYRKDRDFWLGARQSVAFRPAQDWSVAGDRLTPMLVKDAAAASAAALVPATKLPAGSAALSRTRTQFFAPAQLILRDISPRPGVWHMRRLGLASRGTAAKEGGPPPKPLAAPELPFHARAPRPPITGVNDRVRASEFEPLPFKLSSEPQFVLYGPRVAPPHAPGPASAISRAPLSESAWLGTVVTPKQGLINRRWDGTITLSLGPLSMPESTPGWVLDPESARALIGASVFPLQVGNPTADGSPSGDATLTSPGFAEHVAGLRLSTRALIECEFELRVEGAPKIRRLISFELLVAPGGGVGVEQPFYIRFEDPAYDDRLTFPAKFAPDAGQALFCADRDNVRPDDRLTVAWRGIGNEDDPAVPAEFFRWIERQQPKPDGTFASVTIRLKSIEASVGRIESWASIDCARLEPEAEEPSEPFVRLEVGDRLAVSTAEPPTNGTGRAAGAALYFDVTLEPLFPGNPAAFALLRLAQTGPALSAPLYAQSPAPISMELIDPRDLFNGVARFRAAYRWIHFAPPSQGDALYYFVQKIAGDGGTYLADRLEDWPQARKKPK